MKTSSLGLSVVALLIFFKFRPFRFNLKMLFTCVPLDSDCSNKIPYGYANTFEFYCLRVQPMYMCFKCSFFMVFFLMRLFSIVQGKVPKHKK